MGKERTGPRSRRRRTSPQSDGVARRRRILQGVNVTIGVGIALLGAGLMAIAAGGLATGGDAETSRETPAMLIVLFGAMAWWGLQIGWPELAPRPLVRRLLAWRASSGGPVSDPPDPSASEAADRERRVLALAEKEQGRVTVLEVAGRCDLTADDAKSVLDGLVLRQVAQLQVSEAGILVYVFPRKTSPP